jgi:hypothetical protein
MVYMQIATGLKQNRVEDASQLCGLQLVNPILGREEAQDERDAEIPINAQNFGGPLLSRVSPSTVGGRTAL